MVNFKNLDTFSANDVKNLLNSIDFVLFDIDGVLLRNKLKIPGAEEAIAKLRKLGKKIGFVTNNSLYPVNLICQNLKPFNATLEEIVNPNHTLIYYLKEIGYKKDIYVIGSSLVKQLLRDEGYTVLDVKDIDPNPIGESIDAMGMFYARTLEVCKNVGIVLIDIDLNATCAGLQAAKVILNNNKDAIVLSGVSDDTGPIGSNMKIICTKFMIDGIERWCNKKCIEMAKPGKAFKFVVEKKFNITNCERVLIFGDNVETDIALGANCGYKTCLVFSGNVKKHEVHPWIYPENFKPNYVADSIAVFYEKIKNF